MRMLRRAAELRLGEPQSAVPGWQVCLCCSMEASSALQHSMLLPATPCLSVPQIISVRYGTVCCCDSSRV